MQLYIALLNFLQTALCVSVDTVIHHQEHIQTVITISGTGQTVFATVRWRGGVGTPTDGLGYHPKHVEMSAENIIKLYIVASCWTVIDNDSRCTDPWT